MSVIAENTIRVEQMLHGYSSGHRLLSSSCSLSKSGERHARTMSDLSGASFKPGFDGYLSGYPLEEDKLFAIAKTWFAKELPRPGCVWTHTLLIPFEDLGRVEAFDELLGAFRQPSGDDFKEYSNSLMLPLLGERAKTTEPLDYVAHVMGAIYSHPDDIVALPSKSAGEHEGLLLAIWRQQWPSLRSHFSFCTGALELRVGENRLDVQVIPDEKRLVQKASNKALVVELNGSHDIVADEAWMTLATKDLLGECDGSFKRFLGAFADTEHRSRADFRRYSVCFGELNSKKQFPDVAATVAKEFPKGNDAKTLKAAIAGRKKERSFFENTKDVDILRALLLHEEMASAFELRSLGVGDRFGELWTAQEEEGWRLLTDVADNEQSEAEGYLTDAVASVVSEDSIARMAAERCDLAAEVVKRNLSLAVVSEVWKCRELSVSSLCDEFIDLARSNEDFAKGVVAAWVVADRQDCGKELAETVGPAIVASLLGLEPNILSLMDRQSGEWHVVLRDSSDVCLDWLRNQEAASAEAACLATLGVTPGEKKLDVAVLEAWERANSKIPDVTQLTLSHAYVTMLAAAFDNAHVDTAESVTCICFPTVYELAMQNGLSEEHWVVLKNRLPHSGSWWDRCRKLRMGLLDYCVKNEWSIDTFIRCTSVGLAFEEVLNAWGLDQAEKSYLGHVVKSVLRGGGDANRCQRKAAKKYGYWL